MHHIWKLVYHTTRNFEGNFFNLNKCLLFQNVIDGDLCEQFNSMEPSKQRSVSEELDRNPSEVSLAYIFVSIQP